MLNPDAWAAIRWPTTGLEQDGGITQAINAYAFAFCCALRQFSHDSTPFSLWHTIRGSVLDEVLGLNSLHSMPTFLEKDIYPHVFGDILDCGPRAINERTKALVGAAVIYSLLFDALVNHDHSVAVIWQVGPGMPMNTDLLPKFKKIPFQSMFFMPVPFTQSAPERLLRCHTFLMTMREFLDDDEWLGFSTISFRRNTTPSLASPMRDVRFYTRPSDADRDEFRFLASGIDRFGEFFINGHVDRTTCQITATKRSVSINLQWECSCIMLPCGIVGTWWGNSGWGGWIWLWKVDWTDFCPICS